MKRTILTTMIGLLATIYVAFAQPRIDDSLLVAARKALSQEICTNEIVRALNTGLWNSNRTALAISVTRPKASLVFVFLRQSGDKYLGVDISGVENGNLGKIGTADRKGYDRFETVPVLWLHRDDGKFQIMMRTRVWKSGKRYSVSEPMLIGADGTPFWR